MGYFAPGGVVCTWLVLVVLRGDCWSRLVGLGRGEGRHSLATISVSGFRLVAPVVFL